MSDRIEKKTLLRAPRDRVWHAIADSKQFGTWFGVEFDAPFAPGARLVGKIRPTQVDAEVAKLQVPYDGRTFEWTVERIEPMTHISFRWHPFAVDPNIDYSKEPTTLVVFELAEASGGTMLTMTESGFDKIPLERRASAFKANEGGWELQAKLIEKYLSR
jgi:uncharacterized protein YndB with AHSA1/START domain